MSRRTGSLALLLALAVLPACGDDGDDGGGGAGDGDDRESSSTEKPAAGDDECAFLTTGAVTAAVGADMELTTAGPQTCFFSSVDEASELRVTLNLVPLAIDPGDYARGARDQCEGEVTDVEVPDAVDAFACVAFTTQGFLFVGPDSVVIDVEGTPDDATGVGAAAAMLPEVTLD